MTVSFQKILVALDASPRAPGVLAVAVDLAQRYSARLSLFRAVGMPPASELQREAMEEMPDDVPRMLENHAEHDLIEWSKKVPPGLLGKVTVHIGTAWQAICRAAEEEGADLIVIGSHGYGGLDVILGTTAAKVVNHAERSVLVVRNPKT
jgi:nucleotide-binding universal stress UspA family protein